MKVQVISIDEISAIKPVEDEMRTIIEKARLLDDGKALKVRYTSKKYKKYWLLHGWAKKLDKKLVVAKRGNVIYIYKKVTGNDIVIKLAKRKKTSRPYLGDWKKRAEIATNILASAKELLDTGRAIDVKCAAMGDDGKHLYWMIQKRISANRLPYFIKYDGQQILIEMKLGKVHEPKVTT